MGWIKKHETPIEGVYLLEPQVFGDSRGCFLETWNPASLRQIGLEADFVQDNESTSTGGVLRGMHYQRQHPQGKLVRVAFGEVFDAVVDIRKGSPTFGMWYGALLSDSNHRQLWVPLGMAHGFMVLSPRAVFSYKVTDTYHPQDEGGLLWNDPDIGIQWPEIPQGMTLQINSRDACWPGIGEAFPGEGR